jgi:hypothetical protein
LLKPNYDGTIDASSLTWNTPLSSRLAISVILAQHRPGDFHLGDDRTDGLVDVFAQRLGDILFALDEIRPYLVKTDKGAHVEIDAERAVSFALLVIEEDAARFQDAAVGKLGGVAVEILLGVAGALEASPSPGGRLNGH